MKALLEKKNELMAQAEALIDDAEQRNADVEESAYVELRTQIEDINAQMEAKEKEIQEKRTAINAEIQGESKMEKRELELRGMADFLRGQDSEELRGMDRANTGALIPTHLHGEIIEMLPEVAPLFNKVEKITTSGGNVEILRETEQGQAGFVGEGADLSETAAKFQKVKLEAKRAGAFTKLTQHIINDSAVDVVAYAKKNLYRSLGQALDRAMVVGDKENSFEGLQNVAGVKVVEATGIATDLFVDMINELPIEHHAGAVIVMPRPVFNAVAKLKDGNGHYFMVRDFAGEKPCYKILGCEVMISDVATEIYLVNVESAYAGMITKDAEMKLVNGDSMNAIAGTQTVILDIYTDVKVVNPSAIVKCRVEVARKK